MSETTNIQWCDKTWSPWIGCAKVHAGCDNCYAEELMDHRFHRDAWGPTGMRMRTSKTNWKKPIQWNELAVRQQVRPRIFPSLCDPFEDRQDLVAWRKDFFRLIDETPDLAWILLTKRPENIRDMWPRCGECGYSLHDASFHRDHSICKQKTGSVFMRDNAWLVYSASNQETYDAGLPGLISCSGLAPTLGICLEPLLGPVDLAFPGTCPKDWGVSYSSIGDRIKWVIVGGESGRNARVCGVDWIRDIVEQCRGANVSVYVKQLGANVIKGRSRVVMTDKKGGDPSEWPTDLRVREVPE